MAHSNTALAQILDFVPRHEFEALSRKYPSEVKARNFSRWTQFVAMLAGQLAGLDSLRSIVDYFSTQSKKLYHLGIDRFSRSTLSRANSQNSVVPLFQEIFYKLLARCQEFTPGKNKFDFKESGKIYLIDATLIQLSLSLFSWAKYQKRKGAVKLHVGISSDGYIPTFVDMTAGKEHEIWKARDKKFPAGSWIVFDRGYTDYKWFQKLTKDKVYFVTRLKDNAVFEDCKKRSGRKSEGVIDDKQIKLKGINEIFRIVCFFDMDKKEKCTFLTNAHHIPAKTVAELYKERWQIELFFKWIKQHLKVKSFVGNSVSAVQSQLWIALCAYLIVAFLKFRSRLDLSFLEILRKIRPNLFERRNLQELLAPPKLKIPRKTTQLSILQNL